MMKKLLTILILVFLVGCTPKEYTVDPFVVDAAVQAYLEEHLEEIQADVNIDINDLNDLMTSLIQEVDKSVIGVVNYNGLDEPGGTGSGVVYKYDFSLDNSVLRE